MDVDEKPTPEAVKEGAKEVKAEQMDTDTKAEATDPSKDGDAPKPAGDGDKKDIKKEDDASKGDKKEDVKAEKEKEEAKPELPKKKKIVNEELLQAFRYFDKTGICHSLTVCMGDTQQFASK